MAEPPKHHQDSKKRILSGQFDGNTEQDLTANSSRGRGSNGERCRKHRGKKEKKRDSDHKNSGTRNITNAKLSSPDRKIMEDEVSAHPQHPGPPEGTVTLNKRHRRRRKLKRKSQHKRDGSADALDYAASALVHKHAGRKSESLFNQQRRALIERVTSTTLPCRPVRQWLETDDQKGLRGRFPGQERGLPDFAATHVAKELARSPIKSRGFTVEHEIPYTEINPAPLTHGRHLNSRNGVEKIDILASPCEARSETGSGGSVPSEDSCSSEVEPIALGGQTKDAPQARSNLQRQSQLTRPVLRPPTDVRIPAHGRSFSGFHRVSSVPSYRTSRDVDKSFRRFSAFLSGRIQDSSSDADSESSDESSTNGAFSEGDSLGAESESHPQSLGNTSRSCLKDSDQLVTDPRNATDTSSSNGKQVTEEFESGEDIDRDDSEAKGINLLLMRDDESVEAESGDEPRLRTDCGLIGRHSSVSVIQSASATSQVYPLEGDNRQLSSRQLSLDSEQPQENELDESDSASDEEVEGELEVASDAYGDGADDFTIPRRTQAPEAKSTDQRAFLERPPGGGDSGLGSTYVTSPTPGDSRAQAAFDPGCFQVSSIANEATTLVADDADLLQSIEDIEDAVFNDTRALDYDTAKPPLGKHLPVPGKNSANLRSSAATDAHSMNNTGEVLLKQHAKPRVSFAGLPIRPGSPVVVICGTAILPDNPPQIFEDSPDLPTPLEPLKKDQQNGAMEDQDLSTQLSFEDHGLPGSVLDELSRSTSSPGDEQSFRTAAEEAGFQTPMSSPAAGIASMEATRIPAGVKRKRVTPEKSVERVKKPKMKSSGQIEEICALTSSDSDSVLRHDKQHTFRRKANNNRQSTGTKSKHVIPGKPTTMRFKADTQARLAAARSQPSTDESDFEPLGDDESPVKKTSSASKKGRKRRETDPDNNSLSPAPKQRRVAAATSASTFPSMNVPEFGLIQEKLWRNPFRLTIVTMFLNQTAGRTAVPTFWQIMERYPTIEDLAAADQNEVFEMIKHLGLGKQRSERIVKVAQAWIDDPPTVGRRHRTLHYPTKGDGADLRAREILEYGAEAVKGAHELGHMKGTGPYAWDSWRIFCRDVFRGVAEDYNGKGAADGFEPEWKRVLPVDKELRACLQWMWLKEGWMWDPMTGEKRRADEEMMRMAKQGQVDGQ